MPATLLGWPTELAEAAERLRTAPAPGLGSRLDAYLNVGTGWAYGAPWFWSTHDARPILVTYPFQHIQVQQGAVGFCVHSTSPSHLREALDVENGLTLTAGEMDHLSALALQPLV